MAYEYHYNLNDIHSQALEIELEYKFFYTIDTAECNCPHKVEILTFMLAKAGTLTLKNASLKHTYIIPLK